MIRRLLLLLALLAAATPAAADDIGATARGVVRIVTIAVVDGQVVGFGHGSGVAIAPNRVVTNAHVTELAQRYPDNVVVGVVPSEGDKSFQGHVVAYDAKADLAMIEFSGARLPPATLYTGPVNEGDPVVALGYPGNVDLATARSAADYIRPTSPVRSEGVFSGRRSLTGVEVLLHTASIARGNSGGPLLDRCGRVIGINSAITRGEEGDSSFGFAIADTELAAFLRKAKQPFQQVGTPCTSIEERMRDDSEADARARSDAATNARETMARDALAREETLAAARTAALTRREDRMALAGLMLVLGAMGIGAAGFLVLQGDRRRARWALGGGAALMAAAVVVYLLRPSAEVSLPAVAAAARPASTANAPLGKLTCSLVPERSRVTVSSTADVPLDWGRSGCVNGRTQYLPDGDRWQRVLVPDGEQTVSVLGFDPATRTYTNTRYLLGAGAMEMVRKLRGDTAPKACTIAPGAIDRLAQAEAAIRATLPPLPNEKLVYTCRKGG
ncbi:MULTISPECIES: S1C family serine protease [unclassified Sphingomonas]|jgi:Trypsin-like peptidase domain|uniref:S1C family serine protease n=1 Tax=unclassified Sphingomonas TaxID=196159 RepID=UPI000E10B56F|nr:MULTISPECIES: trypsin-like peptidase domain-containing protein [unclassified Sphingomonas]AXJ94745.1 serine protease [Sphingomonas sp. FARSPH]